MFLLTQESLDLFNSSIFKNILNSFDISFCLDYFMHREHHLCQFSYSECIAQNTVNVGKWFVCTCKEVYSTFFKLNVPSYQLKLVYWVIQISTSNFAKGVCHFLQIFLNLIFLLYLERKIKVVMKTDTTIAWFYVFSLWHEYRGLHFVEMHSVPCICNYSF